MLHRYLIVVEDDVEPFLEGPFESDEARVLKATEHRQETQDDGLYRLDIHAPEGVEIEVASFMNCELLDSE